MIQFKNFGRETNHYNLDFLKRLQDVAQSERIFVIQEKAHGASICFLCDGKDVVLATRGGILSDSATFYNHHELTHRYKKRVLTLYERISVLYSRTSQICIFGEMIGGHYPHPKVAPDKTAKPIQTDVFYCPNHEFYANDIFIMREKGSCFLPLFACNIMLERTGFFYARTLFQGTLDECIERPNTFPSRIPFWLHLPIISGNDCYGINIRPIQSIYISKYRRAILKSKSVKLTEDASAAEEFNKLLIEMLQARATHLPT